MSRLRYIKHAPSRTLTCDTCAFKHRLAIFHLWDMSRDSRLASSFSSSYIDSFHQCYSTILIGDKKRNFLRYGTAKAIDGDSVACWAPYANGSHCYLPNSILLTPLLCFLRGRVTYVFCRSNAGCLPASRHNVYIPNLMKKPFSYA